MTYRGFLVLLLALFLMIRLFYFTFLVLPPFCRSALRPGTLPRFLGPHHLLMAASLRSGDCTRRYYWPT
jgi:hypothetical protein